MLARPTSMCHAVSEHQRHAGGLVEVQAVRNRDHVHRGNGDQLTISAVHAIAQHGEFRALVLKSGDALGAVIAEMHGRQQYSLPRLEAGDVLADFDDLSCDVRPQNVRQGHSGQTFADPEIDMVQGAGLDADQNLVLARLGIGHIFVAQNFRTTEFMDADGFHRSSAMKSNYHRACRRVLPNIDDLTIR